VGAEVQVKGFASTSGHSSPSDFRHGFFYFLFLIISVLILLFRSASEAASDQQPQQFSLKPFTVLSPTTSIVCLSRDHVAYHQGKENDRDESGHQTQLHLNIVPGQTQMSALSGTVCCRVERVDLIMPNP
jgi:hypothetical protein